MWAPGSDSCAASATSPKLRWPALWALSASYVNQIEHDVRPLTVPVLQRITNTFGVDATFFSRDDDSRLLAEVQDVVMGKEITKASMAPAGNLRDGA